MNIWLTIVLWNQNWFQAQCGAKDISRVSLLVGKNKQIADDQNFFIDHNFSSISQKHWTVTSGGNLIAVDHIFHQSDKSWLLWPGEGGGEGWARAKAGSSRGGDERGLQQEGRSPFFHFYPSHDWWARFQQKGWFIFSIFDPSYNWWARSSSVINIIPCCSGGAESWETETDWSILGEKNREGAGRGGWNYSLSAI